MSIILAIVIFSAIVLFHELGHFLLAKKSGIVVVEFSLGMGPRLLSTVKGGTRYSLKAFPIGGSCMMLGEDTDETLPGSFHAASLPGRICTVAAGPVFNFILAFGLSIVIVALAGYDPPTVAYVDPESNAYAAGLREGDLITGFDGYSKRSDNYFDVSREYSFAKEKASYFNEYVKNFLASVKNKLDVKFVTKSRYVD